MRRFRLSRLRLAGIAVVAAAFVGVLYAASDDFSIFCARLAIFIVCLAVPVLHNMEAEKEDFVDTFDRTESE
jgi:hypothetical protein